LIDKRKDHRINKKLVVSYGDIGFEKIGMTLNISSKGMCVLSQTSLPVNKKVLLNLAIIDNIYEIMGLVRWSKSGISKDSDNVPIGMGIKILNAPQGYFGHIEHFTNNRFYQNL